jgi:hypothetical protein
MTKIKLAVTGIISLMLIGFVINSCNNEPESLNHHQS